MIVLGKIVLIAGGLLGALMLGGGGAAAGPATPGKGPLTPVKPIGGAKPPKGSPGVDFPPPSGDRTPQAKGGPDPSDPRVDLGMPAALRAATIALLDDPNATPEACRAGATIADVAGFPIAAMSLNDKADELEAAAAEGPSLGATAGGGGGGGGAKPAPGPDEEAPLTTGDGGFGGLGAAIPGATAFGTGETDFSGEGPSGFGGGGGAGGAPPPGSFSGQGGAGGAGGGSTDSGGIGDFFGF